MMGLSEGRKSVRIRLAVLIQYRSVTDTQPATQPPSHVAVAITLNPLAKASSLKKTLSIRNSKNSPSLVESMKVDHRMPAVVKEVVEKADFQRQTESQKGRVQT